MTPVGCARRAHADQGMQMLREGCEGYLYYILIFFSS